MNFLNQQIQLADTTEDVLQLVADAWRAGGCPDTAFAIEEHMRGRDEDAEEIAELEAEHTQEIAELEAEHTQEIEGLNPPD